MEHTSSRFHLTSVSSPQNWRRQHCPSSLQSSVMLSVAFTTDAMLTSGSVAFLDLKGFTQLSIVCKALWTSFSSFFMCGALASLWCLIAASYIPAISQQVCRILALSCAFRIQRWTAIKTYKTYLWWDRQIVRLWQWHWPQMYACVYLYQWMLCEFIPYCD